MFHVVGYVPFKSRQKWGFVAPSFFCEKSNKYYIQNEGLHRFLPCNYSEIPEHVIVRVEPSFGTASDIEMNYGFNFDEMKWAVGTKATLREIVCPNGKFPENDTAVSLQMAELWGDLSTKNQIRGKMASDLSQVYGVQTANWFLDTALSHSDFWDIIEENSKKTDDIHGLSSARQAAVLDLDIKNHNLISDEIWLKLDSFLVVDRTEIIKDFWNRNSRGFPAEKIEDYRNYFFGNLNKIGRQEERIGFILSEFIANGEDILHQLDHYTDRAAFAKDAIEAMVTEFRSNRLIDIDRQWIVASFIGRLYTSSFPMQRGILLFDLARFLHSYPIVAEAIRKKTLQSRSMYVRGMEKHIFRALEATEDQAK